MAADIRYPTVVIDPPWSYQNKWQQIGKGNAMTHDGLAGVFEGGIRGAAAKYATMDLAEIAKVPIHEWAAKNAHVYLWTTNSFLHAGLHLMALWGADYKTPITWVKTQIGMGMYYRNTTEHALFGVRGSLRCRRADVPTHFVAPRREHSEKPDAFYEMVESMSPGPYLDVFARKQRSGWAVWGDEVEGPPQLPTPTELMATMRAGQPEQSQLPLEA